MLSDEALFQLVFQHSLNYVPQFSQWNNLIMIYHEADVGLKEAGHRDCG